MPINLNKILVKHYHSSREYLAHKPEPLHWIDLHGLIKSVENDKMIVEICAVEVSEDEFTGSTSGSDQYFLIEIPIGK